MTAKAIKNSLRACIRLLETNIRSLHHHLRDVGICVCNKLLEIIGTNSPFVPPCISLFEDSSDSEEENAI